MGADVVHGVVGVDVRPGTAEVEVAVLVHEVHRRQEAAVGQ